MCGILFQLNYKNNLTENQKLKFEESLFLQNHRGPDAMQIYSNDFFIMGHNRLSIIDLDQRSNQPFHRIDLGLTIIFNGEIYNYKELKQQLVNKGYTFNTKSDTEVILLLYNEYGKDCVSYLVGMFTFIIYNHLSNDFFAARDRVGEKPFFYLVNKNQLIIASEIGTIKNLVDFDLTINSNAINDLIENLYISDYHTIYNEVEVLKPAHFMYIKNNEIEIETYYNLPYNKKCNDNFEIAIDKVENKLNQIIENQLQVDVPVATFLSSGVDSSLITSLALQQKKDIIAITFASEEKDIDESEIASKIAKNIGIKHKIIKGTNQSIEFLPYILKNIQPLADASILPTYLVTQHLKNDYKVMLSGDGGDEVFGTYNKVNIYNQINKYGYFSTILNTLIMNSSYFYERINEKRKLKWGDWDSYYLLNNLNKPILHNIIDSENLFQANYKKYNQFKNNFSQIDKTPFYMGFLTHLSSDFLYKTDSASMLNSLEIRTPFLDHNLIDYTLSLPVNSLFPNKKDKEITKFLAKKYTQIDFDLLPKKGFSIPYGKYLQGKWGNLIIYFLYEKLSQDYLGFNKYGIIELIEQNRKQINPKYTRILYAILTLEIWLRVSFLNQNPLELEQKIKNFIKD